MSWTPTLQSIFLTAGALVATAGVTTHAGSHETEGAKGHLIISGGGLRGDNAEVFERMMELVAGGKLGVVPTASANPESSGSSAVDRINQYSETDQAFYIDIPRDDPEAAHNSERIAELDSAQGLFFTGGVQTRIVDIFRPEEGDTPAYEAVHRVLQRNGMIAGTSAGAAMMSDPMIQRGTSRAALARGATHDEPADQGVSVGKGMGFYPYGITGQHFMTRGRMGRLIVALENAGLERGIGVEDNRAMHVNLNTDMIEGLGGHRALLAIDISSLERGEGEWRNIRLSLLHSGDRINGLTHDLVPYQSRHPRPITTNEEATTPEEEDAWGRHAIPNVMVETIIDGAAYGLAWDPNYRLTFTPDSETKAWIGPDNDPRTLTIHRMRLDIEPREEGAGPEVASE